jgi:hypothetical protein
MATQRARVPGGKTIVHKVKVTSEEEQILRERAAVLGVSVSRLLAESALGEIRAIPGRVLINEVQSLRYLILNTGKFTEEDAKNFGVGLDKFLAGAQ